MEIKIISVNNGIHYSIRVDVEGAELEYLPILERIVKIVEEYNKEQVDEA